MTDTFKPLTRKEAEELLREAETTTSGRFMDGNWVRALRTVLALDKKLASARVAMSQALDALESDADLEARRAAFERIQDEFEDAEITPLEQQLAALRERLVLSEESERCAVKHVGLLNEGIHALRQAQEAAAAREKELVEALLQHRSDLHQYSSRPCPTCRRSAQVLGIAGGVPYSCARAESDNAALARYSSASDKEEGKDG